MPDPRLSPRRPRRQCGNPPAGHCCIRQCAFSRRLPPFAPAPQQKGGGAGAFCCELQSAARHRRKRPDFADHCDNAWGTQPLLHRPQDVGRSAGANEDEPARVDAEERQARPVEIEMAPAPEHWAVARAHEPADKGQKKAYPRPVRLRPLAHDFMHARRG